MEQFKLSIPKPCNQDWATMDTTQNGKYCGHCTKEVIDFRNLSTAELKKWLSTVNGKVCGRFNEAQIQNINTEPLYKSTWSNLGSKLIMASCLALLTNSKVFSSPFTKKVSETYQGEKEFKIAKEEVILATDSLITIKGTVKSADDGLPIPSVTIRVKNTSQSFATDQNGAFIIRLNLKPDQRRTLVFSYVGLETKKVIVDPNNSKTLAISLSMRGSLMGEVVVVKPTIWHKIKYLIRRTF